MSYNKDENPDLLKKVEKDTELKKWLVNLLLLTTIHKFD